MFREAVSFISRKGSLSTACNWTHFTLQNTSKLSSNICKVAQHLEVGRAWVFRLLDSSAHAVIFTDDNSRMLNFQRMINASTCIFTLIFWPWERNNSKGPKKKEWKWRTGKNLPIELFLFNTSQGCLKRKFMIWLLLQSSLGKVVIGSRVMLYMPTDCHTPYIKRKQLLKCQVEEHLYSQTVPSLKAALMALWFHNPLFTSLIFHHNRSRRRLLWYHFFERL